MRSVESTGPVGALRSARPRGARTVAARPRVQPDVGPAAPRRHAAWARTRHRPDRPRGRRGERRRGGPRGCRGPVGRARGRRARPSRCPAASTQSRRRGPSSSNSGGTVFPGPRDHAVARGTRSARKALPTAGLPPGPWVISASTPRARSAHCRAWARQSATGSTRGVIVGAATRTGAGSASSAGWPSSSATVGSVPSTIRKTLEQAFDHGRRRAVCARRGSASTRRGNSQPFPPLVVGSHSDKWGRTPQHPATCRGSPTGPGSSRTKGTAGRTGGALRCGERADQTCAVAGASVLVSAIEVERRFEM